MNEHRVEPVTFRCPLLKGVAHLTFEYVDIYVDQLPTPVRTGLPKPDCDGKLRCGITPQLSAGSWGMTEWDSCTYPNLKIKGTR